MKKFLLALLIHSCLMTHAQPEHVVISQVFGAGGNSGALFKNDFVELYNPTATTVSLQGWSLQYSTATGSSWNSNKVDLSGSIAPGKYFLIQLSGATSGSVLPQPDLASTNINVSATSGKVALVNNKTTLTGNCPTGASIVDFVGFGSADCAETKPVAVLTYNSNAFVRLNNGCMDSDNNNADFIVDVPSPRNSGSPGNFCGNPSVSISGVSPAVFCVDGTNHAPGTVMYQASGSFNNATIRVMLSDVNGTFAAPIQVGTATISGTNPSGIIAVSIPAQTASGARYRLRIDVAQPAQTGMPTNSIEIINGAKNISAFIAAPNTGQMTLHWTNPPGCYDEIMIVARETAFSAAVPAGDGSAYESDLLYTGNGTHFDGGKVVYKGTASGPTVTGLTNGTRYYFKAFTRRGPFWSTGAEASETARLVPLPGEVLINQVHSGYNKATDEYIELVNVTNKIFDLSDLALRFADANGSNVVAGGTLSGTLLPHSYWLVSPNASITVGLTQALPADNKMDGGFGVQNQQVALLRKTDNTLLDAVAYGTIANPTYMEGSAAPNPGTNNGLKRLVDGVDNNNNQKDFIIVKTGDIDLRNGSSRLANSHAQIDGGSYKRIYVTGPAALAGAVTLTEKLVLGSGHFSLHQFDLTTPDVVGGSPAAYVKTNSSGHLIIQNIQAAKTFAVGNSTYNPVTISQGSNQGWRVRVADEVPKQTALFSENKAVWRTWHIAPLATPATGATLELVYNDQDATQTGRDFDKKAPVQVWSFQTNNWLPAGDAQQPSETGETKSVTFSGVTQPAALVIANASAVMSVLPVRFSGVKATELPQGIQIEFTNSTESEVLHYIIERSVNGIDFTPVVTLQPQHNNGSSASYTWLDGQRRAGPNFYRIKGVETDGKYLYSPILKVTVNRTIKSLTVFPSPVKGRQLSWESTLPQGKYILRVTGSSGQQVLTQRFDYSGGNISQVMELPAGVRPGVYTLQIINGNFFQQQSFVVL